MLIKKITIYILAVAFAVITADPAAAWFWDKKQVKSPEVASAVKQDTKEAVTPVKKKGLWTRIKDSFRGVKKDAKQVGKNVKKDSKKGAKDVKTGAKSVGRDLKDACKKTGQEAKKIPGELKKGGKAVGQGFKQLGNDIKKGTKDAFE